MLIIEQLDILNGIIEALGVVKEKILKTKNKTEKFEKIKQLIINCIMMLSNQYLVDA